MDSMETPMTSTGLPWLDSPLMLHSSRADNCTLTPQQCEYRSGFWRYWYQADHVYALGTVYFMCAVIGVFAIAHGLSIYSPAWVYNNRASTKVRALVRYLSYSTVKQYRGLRVFPGASLGVGLLVLVGVVFFAAMTLGPKPYYWHNTDAVSFGNSPPIATRAGWMALALLPFVLAFAAKANLISALTGIPYEKLQIFHHWASYAMFVLALIHTFPFIVYHIQKGDMVMQWDTSVVYWTGVATLIPQAYLTFMSIPWIRNRYYEFFKSTHITVSILFIFFFFIHCDFTLTSWDYFIAAGAIYLFSVVYAWSKTYLFHGLHTAQVSLLPCGGDDNSDEEEEELIEITIPTTISWKPGQHVFLRFLTMHPHSLTAHPFTISSVPHKTEICGHPSEMKFFVKPAVARKNNKNSTAFTARLARAVAGKAQVGMRVLLEGPYSGVDNASLLARFDHIVYIAGGSGAGFSLGVVEDAIRSEQRKNTQTVITTTVQVVYATRSVGVARWYKDKIEDMMTIPDSSCCCRVAASIHITSAARKNNKTSSQKQLQDTTEVQETDTEKITDSSTSPSDSSSTETSPLSSSAKKIQIHNDNQRPNIKSVISSACRSDNYKKIAVVVCGPASMIHDARQAVANEQARLLKEESGLGEVYLHVEAFSW